MAFTGSPVDSVQRTAEKGPDRQLGIYHLYMARANYTHSAGAGTGEINMFRLPPGKIVVFPDISKLNSSTMATGADLHLGHRAFTNEDGTAVVEDDNEWLDNKDAGGALDINLDLPTNGVGTANEYNSQEGIEVFVKIDTGNIEDGDTIDLYMMYARVG